MDQLSIFADLIGNLVSPDMIMRAIWVIGILYFVPTFAAVYRHHRKALLIAFTNIVLGWTVIGWVAVCFWAFSKDIHRPSTLGGSPLPAKN